MLHACGDSILNLKLRTAPITAYVFTMRCSVYYNLKLTKRFENLAEVVHIARGVNTKFTHIPKTAKRVVINGNIACFIPASVDELIVDHIGSSATFERKPGELIVNVSPEHSFPFVHPEYVTHLRGGRSYSVNMTNLQVIFLYDGVKMEPIPGVKFEYMKRDCGHPSQKEVDFTGVHPMTVCTSCGENRRVLIKHTSQFLSIPPRAVVTIDKDHFYAIRGILGKMTEGCKRLKINAHVDEINDFCSSGGFDLIPHSVAKVQIFVHPRHEDNGYVHTPFVGIHKAYPFMVYIEMAGAGRGALLENDGAIGIDQCNQLDFMTDAAKNLAMSRNPRLSVIF